MSSKPIVLVTGGTGFVGSHVVHQLLEQKKYIVRATARQTSKLLRTFPDAALDLQVVHVPSLTSDHSEALQGVWALIHCAAALPRNTSARDTFLAAYEGAVNVVEAAINAGVKKIVVTGSFANLIDPDFKAAFGTETLSEKSWTSITSVDEIDYSKPSFEIYGQAKALAEKKIWQLAHENPDVDVTVLLPPAIFGPFVPNYPPPERTGLGSVHSVYELIIGGMGGPNTYPTYPAGHIVDVRDCAKAHILSLSTPPIKNRDKRFLVEWPTATAWSWKEIADVVRRERPELASRLPADDAPLPPTLTAPHDSSFTEEGLGMKKDDWMPLQKTILDTIDALLVWEEQLDQSA